MADAAAEDQPLPKHLCCPITMELMSDPVVADDGNTYACRARVSACPRARVPVYCRRHMR